LILQNNTKLYLKILGALETSLEKQRCAVTGLLEKTATLMGAAYSKIM